MSSSTPEPTPDVDRLKARWSGYLRRERLKVTQQRELIVDLFLRSPGHVSIDDLLARVRHESPTVGYATVYRTLKLLTECGIAATRHFGEGQTRWEVADDHHHDHLICEQCGLILEFENEEIERLQEQVAIRLGGFQVVRHKMELYGLCPRAQGVANGPCPNVDAPALDGN